MLLFVSHATQDTELLDELCTYMAPLERDGRLRLWHSGLLQAGEDTDVVTLERFGEATVVILLISASYLADPKCEDEARRALDRARRGTTHVVPILLRPCLTNETPLASLRVLPSNGRPVMAWEHREDAWSDIANGLAKLLKTIQYSPMGADPDGRLATLAICEQPKAAIEPVTLDDPIARERAPLGATFSAALARVPNGYRYAVTGAGLAAFSFFVLPWAAVMDLHGQIEYTGTGFDFMAHRALHREHGNDQTASEFIVIPVAVAIIFAVTYSASKADASQGVASRGVKPRVLGNLTLLLCGVLALLFMIVEFGQGNFSTQYGFFVALIGFALVAIGAGIMFISASLHPSPGRKP